MFKKLGFLLLCICLVISLAACGGDAVDTGAGLSSDTSSVVSETESETESSETSDVSSSESEPESQPAPESSASSTTSDEKKPSANKSDAFTVSGQKLEIGMNVTDSVIKKLGDAIDVQSAPSCHFDGEDTIYVYDNYSLYTYADGDKDVLYLIEISAEGVTTAEGIGIGSTCDEVKKAYGEPVEETATALCYETSTAFLRISHDGSVVELIEYEEK